MSTEAPPPVAPRRSYCRRCLEHDATTVAVTAGVDVAVVATMAAKAQGACKEATLARLRSLLCDVRRTLLSAMEEPLDAVVGCLCAQHAAREAPSLDAAVAVRLVMAHGAYREAAYSVRGVQRLAPIGAHPVLSRLYISAKYPLQHHHRAHIAPATCSSCVSLLDWHAITHVVCCYATGAQLRVANDTVDVTEADVVSRGSCAVPAPRGGRVRLVLPAVDDEGYDLQQHFPAAVTFAAAALQDEHARVLVHCSAGMHRSAAVLAAIVIRLARLPVEQALSAIKTARPIAQPIPAAVAQLEAFASSGFSPER